MSKHTPGPWIGAGPSFGDPLPRYTTEIVTDWEDEDGEVLPICTLPFHHHDDENEANARLIEQAPALLDVLKHVRAVLPHERWADDTKKMVDAAIAKAEGQHET